MEKEYQFKTNINCTGCVANVTPFLAATDGIEKWDVDTENKDKILTVQSNGATPKEIQAAIEKAGYKITPL